VPQAGAGHLSLRSGDADRAACASFHFGTQYLHMRNEIAFKPDAAMETATRDDFTYKITPTTITIMDTTLGKLSVVLRKIEHWHQGSIAASKIMYRDEDGLWNGIRWND
jgi:hypothetical protein